MQLKVKNLLSFLIFMFLFLTSGCVSPKFSMIRKAETPDHPIRTIALISNERDFPKAVKVELLNQGFNIVEIEPNAVSTNMSAKSFSGVLPASKDTKKAIDAYLSIAAVWSNDGFLHTANVRLDSTHTGHTIVWFSWRNGYGITDGIPDRIVKKNLTEAAQAIVAKLTKNITLR